MYKVALLGCGKRSEAHAEAYGAIARAKLVTACSRNAERLQAFCERYNITRRYHDLDGMLRAERPDLLHIVTGPARRCEAMRIASEAGVPAVIIEKPIALEAEEYRLIAALARETSTRFAVNTQLHYHPANIRLRGLVAGGDIGDIRMIVASARSTPVNQGPHVLQLVSGYARSARPKRVIGQISGVTNMADQREPSPDDAVAAIEMDDGSRVLLAVGERVGLKTSDNPSRFFHKQIAVYGTLGNVRWTMSDWESLTPAGRDAGIHEYMEENRGAQVGLTQAVLDWIEDAACEPAVSLNRALDEFQVLLGIYTSALMRQPVDLPFDPPNGLLDAIRATLHSEELVANQ